jgi:L-ribulose-5-phosphate 4-epimerase
LTAHLELRERALAANQAIVAAGLVTLTFGNVSELDRDAGVMAIKPSGVPYERLTAEDVVVLDLETGVVLASGLRPSSDTPTHLELYRRFDRLGGIVHTHSTAAAGWAQARREIPCFGTTHADHFRGSVPVTRDLTDEEIEGEYERLTGHVIAETFETRGLDPLATPGVLVASHGPFAFGADGAEAVENAIALEHVAELAFRSVLLEAEGPIGEALHRRHHERKHGPSAYYGQGGTR